MKTKPSLPLLTVNQLAKLANVTRRTLHYYDEVGLLKPSQVGENGYRYYGEDTLLRLQQIMLYRELDMPLENILRIIERDDFDVVAALERHRSELRKRIERMERLCVTVENTIQHLKGKQKMSHQQLFEPFSDEQQEAYAEQAMQLYDPAVVKTSMKKWKNYNAAEKERIMKESGEIYLEFQHLRSKGADAPEVQMCVERWRRNIEYFWTPNEAQLLGLATGYVDDPSFRATFDKIDPQLAPFIREAVEVYIQGKKK